MKLFKILNKLSTKELNQFGHFLNSPLFNKREDIRVLFEHWMKAKRRSHPPQVYWKMVHPKLVFSETQWNLLTSRVFKLLEEFLAISEVRKSPSQKQILLTNSYRKLQQEFFFKSASKKAEQQLGNHPLRDTSYLLKKYNLSYERYDYIISINRDEKTNLQEVSNNLDTFFIASKLKQACYAINRKLIHQEEYSIGLLQETLTHIATNPQYLKHPAIAIYYYCFLMMQTGEDDLNFKQFRTSITQNQAQFSATELRDIYTFAINYFIRKLNTGSTSYIKETFELYLLSLEQGYLLEDGVMLESTYSNIIWLATKQKKYGWAKNFIENYQSNLKPEFQKPLVYFNLGKIYYEQDQLDKSLAELIKVETRASFLFLGARILQLKIYYELSEYDLLESLLDSIRVYLQRSKDLAYRKAHYSSIISFTKQLLQLPTMTREEKGSFRQRIQKAEVFAERDWFLKQIK